MNDPGYHKGIFMFCIQQPLATHGNVALSHRMKRITFYNALNRNYSVTLVQPRVVTIIESRLLKIKKEIRNFSFVLYSSMYTRKKYFYFIFTIMNRNRILEVNHSLLSVAEAKNEWSYTSILPVIIYVVCGENILDKGEW